MDGHSKCAVLEIYNLPICQLFTSFSKKELFQPLNQSKFTPSAILDVDRKKNQERPYLNYLGKTYNYF